MNYDQYKDDYIALNVGTIKDTVLQEKITVPFVTSSPSNGIKTDVQGGVAKNPQSNRYGDSKTVSTKSITYHNL